MWFWNLTHMSPYVTGINLYLFGHGNGVPVGFPLLVKAWLDL
jgi:hypothetical protein